VERKPALAARRIVAVAAFVLAVIAGGSAAASASPAPAHSAGVHVATTVSPSTAVPPGDGWYPNAQCTVWQDGWEIASPYTGEVWECGYRDGRWQWYPTGRYVV
jgi:hypothetical protein